MAYYTRENCGFGEGSNHTSSECTNEYSASDVKYVVDSWSTSKFTNNELKMVDGYKARLITLEELENLGYIEQEMYGSIVYPVNVPSWLYNSGYLYSTMSPCGESVSNVWLVGDYGRVNSTFVYDAIVAVRPVINVYKSAISS